MHRRSELVVARRNGPAAILVHDVVSGLFWVGAVVAVLTFGFWIFQILNGSYHVELTARVIGRLGVGPRGGDSVVTPNGPSAFVDIPKPPLLLYVLWIVDVGVVRALGLFGLWQFKAVARSAVDGDPFVAGNAQRLRILGIALLIYQPLINVITYYFGTRFLRAVSLHGVGMSRSFTSWTLLIAGFSVVALSEVFAQGVRLRTDVEGTI